MSAASAAYADSGGRSRPSQLFNAAVTDGRIRAMSVSITPRDNIAPIGTTKHAARKRKSGSTRAAARSCSRRRLFRSARRKAPDSSSAPASAAWSAAAAPRCTAPPALPSALLRDPGVEALVELVEVLQPELVVDVQ